MVKFSQEEMLRFIDSDKCRCQNIYKGTGFQVYVKTKIDAELVNIFAFDNVPRGIKIITEDIHRENLKFVVEKSAEKNRFIDFNNYVISLPSSKENPDQVDFSAAHLYRKRGAAAATPLNLINYALCALVRRLHNPRPLLIK